MSKDLSKMDSVELVKEIFDFLDAHAKTAADYDPDFDDVGERFNGPDSSMLFSAASRLMYGVSLIPVQSSWTSGCYKNMFDASLRAEHDALVDEVSRRAKS